MKRALMAGVFLAVGIAIFAVVQDILTPQYTWPYLKEHPADTFAEINGMSGSDIQAFFVGTSHSAFGIDPMRIYKQSGIATYNLSTSARRIDATYYVLKEAFETQSPRYVLFEAGGLFKEDSEETFLIPSELYPSANSSFRYVLDSTVLNKNKLELAKVYSGYFPDNQRLSAFLGGLLPIWQYHDRWKELGASDFALFSPAQDYFLKGYYLTTVSNAAWVDVSWMNYIAERNAVTDRQKWVRQIEDGAVSETSNDDKCYTPEISETNRSWLRRIKELCEENGAELQMIKVPSCTTPQEYRGAWTKIKSDMTRCVAAEMGIPFIDLLYDVDIGIDWSTDTEDFGRHLNYFGAKKVSDFFAEHFQTECGLEGRYDEAYERDIPAYDAACKVAEFQMTKDISSYIEQLSGFDDVTVFISGTDMQLSLSEGNYEQLRRFGLQTDFNSGNYIDSYLAVKKGSTVQYEASSNRRISKSGEIGGSITYTITSCGWDKGLESSISINGVDYSLHGQGINIVVWDNVSGLVLDSVLFPVISTGSLDAVRDQTWSMEYSPLGCFTEEAYQLNYEKYLMEQGTGNGVGQ